MKTIAPAVVSAKRPSHTINWIRLHRFLLAFVLLFAVALVSGLFYYLAPHTWNWPVSQAALVIHVVSGAASLAAYWPFVRVHQKGKEGGDSRNLLRPWRARRRREEELDRVYRKRLSGHLLNWSLVLLGVSGGLMAAPSLLWLLGVVWLPGYLAYQAVNALHLGLALLAAALIGLHMNRRKGGGRP